MRRLANSVVIGLALLIAQPTAEAQTPLPGLTSLPQEDQAKKKDDHKKDEHKDHPEEHKDHYDDHQHHEPPDIGLRDFFRTGWDEKFEERERKDRAPRFNLFKTRQGFLERVFVVDYGFLSRADAGRFDEHEFAVELAYAINRRFEIDVAPIYTWKSPRGEERRQDGLRWETGVRFQLIDSADTAANFQLHVITPSANVEERQTTVGGVLAGFYDLTNHGLRRVGLYGHVGYDQRFGPREIAAEEPDAEPIRRASSTINYAVAIAKTLTEPERRFIGDFTVFVEGFGVTDLNGSRPGETFISVTPGVRMNLTGREEKAWWLQAGVEIPVAGPRAFDYGLRVALIRDF